MANVQKMQLVVEAENKANATLNQVSDKLETVHDKVDKMKPVFEKMAAIGTAGFLAITAVVGKTIQAYAESEAQLVRVDQAIENVVSTNKKFSDQVNKTFGSIDGLKTKVSEFGAEIQALGGIGDETASEGLAKLLQVTGDYTEAENLARLSADLSISKHIDYESAVKAVTMARAGNVKILKEYGIELDDNATKEEIFAELQKKVGGQYEAFGQTVQGQIQILKQTFGDLQENLGAAFVPVLQQVLDKIKPVIDKMVEWSKNNPELVTKITEVTLAVTGFLAVLGTLGLILPPLITAIGLISWPVLAVAAALTGLTILVAQANFDWSNFLTMIEEKTGLITVLKYAWDNIVTVFQQNLMPALLQLWETFKQFQPYLEAFGKYIGVVLLGALIVLVKFIEVSLIVAITVITKSIELATIAGEKWLSFWDGVSTQLAKVVDWVDRTVEAIKRLNVVQGAQNAINSALGWLPGRASGGPVQAGRAFMVGESGPEMFVPSVGGRIIPNGGSGSIIINIYNNEFLGEEGIADRLGRQIMTTLKSSIKL